MTGQHALHHKVFKIHYLKTKVKSGLASLKEIRRIDSLKSLFFHE